MPNNIDSSESGSSTSSPVSATQRARDYFRERLYGRSMQGFVDVKPFPWQVTQVGSKIVPQNQNIVTEKDVRAAAIQADRERKRRARVRMSEPISLASVHDVARSHDSSGKAPNITPKLPVPRLRRVGKSESLSTENRNSSSGVSSNPKHDVPTVVDMRQKQAAIASGKLERVIPPSQSVAKDISTRAKPPPRSRYSLPGPIPASLLSPVENTRQEQKYTDTSPSPFSSSSRATKNRRSAFTNLTNSADLLEDHRRSALTNLANSADLLDETRRSITSTIRRGAEKTVHNLAHRGDDGQYPSDDDKSFYCIGESQSSPATEEHPTPASSWTSSISNYSSELERSSRLSPEAGGIWTNTETLCRLCKKNSPTDIRGLCLDCEEEFKSPDARYVNHPVDKEITASPRPMIEKAAAKNEGVEHRTNQSSPLDCEKKSKRPVARYAEYPFFDDIPPTRPLNIVKAAKTNRELKENTKSPPLNSAGEATRINRTSDDDPGPPPTGPLPKLPSNGLGRNAVKKNTKLKVQTVARNPRVSEAPSATSDEAVVQSVGEIAKSLRSSKDYVVKRKKMKSMGTGQHDAPPPLDLRKTYNRVTVTSVSDKDTQGDNPEEANPTIGGGRSLSGKERPSSLLRGAENKKRPNSRGEGKKQQVEERDASFYTFYDEILEEARDKPPRKRGDAEERDDAFYRFYDEIFEELKSPWE